MLRAAEMVVGFEVIDASRTRGREGIKLGIRGPSCLQETKRRRRWNYIFHCLRSAYYNTIFICELGDTVPTTITKKRNSKEYPNRIIFHDFPTTYIASIRYESQSLLCASYMLHDTLSMSYVILQVGWQYHLPLGPCLTFLLHTPTSTCTINPS